MVGEIAAKQLPTAQRSKGLIVSDSKTKPTQPLLLTSGSHLARQALEVSASGGPEGWKTGLRNAHTESDIRGETCRVVEMRSPKNIGRRSGCKLVRKCLRLRHGPQGCRLPERRRLPLQFAHGTRSAFRGMRFLSRNLSARGSGEWLWSLAGKAMWLKPVHAGERHCRDGAKQRGASLQRCVN